MTITVEFRKSGRTVDWSGNGSLLEFAESNGLQQAFSCREGVCGTCKTALFGGAVRYFETRLDEPEPGNVLLCCSRPAESVVLDL